MVTSVLVMALLFQIQGSRVVSESPVTLDNGQVRIVITPDLQLVRPGSLLEFTDLATGIDMAAGGEFGGVQSDVFLPYSGTITCLSDTEAVFWSPWMYDHTGSDILPIEISILYRLNGRGLEMIFTVDASNDVELDFPLEVDFYLKAWESATFRNQTTMSDRVIDLGADQGPVRVSGDQSVQLVTSQPQFLSASVLVPNPAKANLVVTAHSPSVPAYLSLRLFDVDTPRENCQGPDLHSLIPTGDLSRYYVGFSLEDCAAPVFISDHPDGYERTASWMLDEIPMIHPASGYIWGFSETSSDSELVSAQLIQLLEEHQDMKMNWLILPDGILTPNRDSAWFEPGYEDSWSHWHCTWRVSTEATEEFLQWLQNMQDDIYPWADRVNLGSHGYHHSPNPDSSFDEYHEFITFEPDEHLERFAMLNADIVQMGLDPSEVSRVIRYSGHRTSLSGLWGAISGGFEFYCNGIRWWDWNGGEYFRDTYISKFQTPEGRIWGTNTVWWADYQSMYPYEYLSTVMQRGKHGLLGGHPAQMLAEGLIPQAYARLDSVCTSLETDYENFGWLFPIEYGEFLEDCYGILWEKLQYRPGGFTLLFSGETPGGLTVVVLLPDEAIVDDLTLDGQPLQWEVRDGGRLFAVLPGITGGNHIITADWTLTGIVEGHEGADGRFHIYIQSPVTSAVSVRASGLSPSAPWEMRLFDISGRLVGEWDGLAGVSGELQSTLDISRGSGTGLPSGVYVLNMQSGSLSVSGSLVVLGD